jgi:hypothetical protein
MLHTNQKDLLRGLQIINKGTNKRMVNQDSKKPINDKLFFSSFSIAIDLIILKNFIMKIDISQSYLDRPFDPVCFYSSKKKPSYLANKAPHLTFAVLRKMKFRD